MPAGQVLGISLGVPLLAQARRYVTFRPDRRRLIREAVWALVLARLAIRLVPFRRIVRFATDIRRDATALVDWEEFTQLAAWAVNASALRLPWNPVCFDRGLALHVLLRRRGIPSVLNYGVQREATGKLAAHVWVTVGDKAVIGGEVADDFACVGRF